MSLGECGCVGVGECGCWGVWVWESVVVGVCECLGVCLGLCVGVSGSVSV